MSVIFAWFTSIDDDEEDDESEGSSYSRKTKKRKNSRNNKKKPKKKPPTKRPQRKGKKSTAPNIFFTALRNEPETMFDSGGNVKPPAVPVQLCKEKCTIDYFRSIGQLPIYSGPFHNGMVVLVPIDNNYPCESAFPGLPEDKSCRQIGSVLHLPKPSF